jgi:hypothetical protein
VQDSEDNDNPIRIGFVPASIQLITTLVSLLTFLLYNDLSTLGLLPPAFS